MKEIRVFSNPNKLSLMTDVNNFLKTTQSKVCDIQYGVSGGLLSTEYSVMIIIESTNS